MRGHERPQLSPQRPRRHRRIPSSSRWSRYDDFIAPRLGTGNRQLQMIFEPKGDTGTALLSADALREMFAVQQQIYDVPITHDGTVYKWRDLCWKDAQGVLHAPHSTARCPCRPRPQAHRCHI